jgi:membrane protease YdiL (CAAX protease family)
MRLAQRLHDCVSCGRLLLIEPEPPMQALFRRLRAEETPPGWGLLWALSTVILAFVFMTLVGGVIGSLIAGTNAALAVAIGWLIGGALTAAYVLLGSRDNRSDLRLSDGRFPLLIAFGVGFGTAVTLDLIAIPFVGRVLPPPEFGLMVEPSAGMWIVLGLFIVGVQPFAEELVFRGALLPSLRAAQNLWVALIVSSLMYALFHQLLYTYIDPPPAAWWYTLAEPLLAGFVFGIVRAATGSTRAAIAAHVGLGVFAVLKTSLTFAIGG